MRYAGVCMCSIFFLGLAVLPFAPETKGKPLPEYGGPNIRHRGRHFGVDPYVMEFVALAGPEIS